MNGCLSVAVLVVIVVDAVDVVESVKIVSFIELESRHMCSVLCRVTFTPSDTKE